MTKGSECQNTQLSATRLLFSAWTKRTKCATRCLLAQHYTQSFLTSPVIKTMYWRSSGCTGRDDRLASNPIFLWLFDYWLLIDCIYPQVLDEICNQQVANSQYCLQMCLQHLDTFVESLKVRSHPSARATSVILPGLSLASDGSQYRVCEYVKWSRGMSQMSAILFLRYWQKQY